MTAIEYIEMTTVGGFDQAEYVSKNDAIHAVALARKEAVRSLWHPKKDRPQSSCSIICRLKNGSFVPCFYKANDNTLFPVGGDECSWEDMSIERYLNIDNLICL